MINILYNLLIILFYYLFIIKYILYFILFYLFFFLKKINIATVVCSTAPYVMMHRCSLLKKKREKNQAILPYHY